MALSSIQQQQFGLKKESVRGTAEASPTKWYPVLSADMEYKLNHLQDEALRGIPDRFAPVAGRKMGSGKLKMNLDAQMVGELFYSLLGSVTSAQQGGSAAYKHTITRSTAIQKQVYTFFLDRGLSVKSYNLGGVKKIALSGGVDSLVTLDADVLFKTEGSGSIGTPAYPTQKYLGFQNVTVKLNGSANTDIKEWSVEIDNSLAPLSTLSQSQDIQDVIAAGKLDLKGGFTIYFQDETERNKFLANTAAQFEINAVGDLIAATYYRTVYINFPEVRYTAYPFGEDSGLLAAKVTLDGFYASGSSKSVQVEVTNTDTAY